MVIHEIVSERNCQWMEGYRQELLLQMQNPPAHCRPSSDAEIFKFFFLHEKIGNLKLVD